MVPIGEKKDPGILKRDSRFGFAGAEGGLEPPRVSPPPPHKANTLTVRNGNLNPSDVYRKDICVHLQNQANQAGMVLTVESP
jgi:hypothetical protein